MGKACRKMRKFAMGGEVDNNAVLSGLLQQLQTQNKPEPLTQAQTVNADMKMCIRDRRRMSGYSNVADRVAKGMLKATAKAMAARPSGAEAVEGAAAFVIIVLQIVSKTIVSDQ